MILHKLIASYLKHGDDPEFYEMQARDAVRWIASKDTRLDGTTRVLDLGCGHGVFGGELIKLGCNVTFADEQNLLLAQYADRPFHTFNIDKDPFPKLGKYDLVICSNVYEHLSKPEEFLASAHHLLEDGGKLYLSWTNWLSPWGGHEFSPFHFLGHRLGQRVFDRVTGRTRKHTTYENLFPTYIGKTIRLIRNGTQLRVLHAAPRYYTEFSFILRIPLVREFAAWNCALFLGLRK